MWWEATRGAAASAEALASAVAAPRSQRKRKTTSLADSENPDSKRARAESPASALSGPKSFGAATVDNFRGTFNEIASRRISASISDAQSKLKEHVDGLQACLQNNDKTATLVLGFAKLLQADGQDLAYNV